MTATDGKQVPFYSLLEWQIMGYELYGATLVGNQAPAIRDLYDRMKDPYVVDLVLDNDVPQQGCGGVDDPRRRIVARRA